jgi:hypothetical protein
MTRLFLTTVIVLFALISFAQINTNQDSSHVKAPDIKITLLGTGTPHHL